MINRDIYQKDPSKRKLLNEGVASVNDDTSSPWLAVLRYELETFVCEGQYRKGLEDILDTFIHNVDDPQQPGVWVSGFYGSGKSHLVKMLRALWLDTSFEDGATARGIADLPLSITDDLTRLSKTAKTDRRGLHAASGTLGAAAIGSVRLALLRIVFKSVDLPEQYPMAKFVLWLRDEGIYEDVRKRVETLGYGWQEELDNFYVAEGLHQALTEVRQNQFSSIAICVETLNNLYPFVTDISDEEMLKAIHQALSIDDKFPLTLIVIDEVQQYIAEDAQRSSEVQDVVEACCKNFGGKLLFIGTGQTAVTGTPSLKKLEGRFTVRIELSDTDVETVVRKVVLQKKPDAVEPIEKVMDANLGEISRHLAGTTLAHRQEDVEVFAQDYPILPVRRRFWETTSRALDPTGTEGQLRNQLSMVHKVVQTNLDSPIGHVVPADYQYFDSADRLLQSRVLPRRVHELTMKWYDGSKDEQLLARACGLVFLVNKISSTNEEIGIKADIDSLADLLVQDLAQGSSDLRAKLPALLDDCELLMKIGEEYRIQTEESTAWGNDFENQRSLLANEPHRIEAERDDRLRGATSEILRNAHLIHGSAKVSREISVVFGPELPIDASKKIYVWVRDGWGADENSIRVEALQAGNQSPTIFVFIPRRSADDLRHNIIDYKAANATLESRGVPSGPEGIEARSSMETTKKVADAKIGELLGEAISGARVFQGGGKEIAGTDLREMALEAANSSIKRLFPQFDMADHPGWEKVYTAAKQGSPDALKAIGYDGAPEDHPVCRALLGAIGAGKTGGDIRTHFEGPQYGWPRDAVDGGLFILLVAGLARAEDNRGKSYEPSTLERKSLGKAKFKVEAITITAEQRIQIRKVLQKLKIKAKQGEELASLPLFLDEILNIAEEAGGDPPRPPKPDVQFVEEIRLMSGNDQLMAVYTHRENLIQSIKAWTGLVSKIRDRLPVWEKLQVLVRLAGGIEASNEIRQQMEAIENQRMLLSEPDPVKPLLQAIQDALRSELSAHAERYSQELEKQDQTIKSYESWSQLSEEQQASILSESEIHVAHELNLGTYEDLVNTLDLYPLASWRDRKDALQVRYQLIKEKAAKYLAPKAQVVDLPSRTLASPEDLQAWLDEVSKMIEEALANGPVIIR